MNKIIIVSIIVFILAGFFVGLYFLLSKKSSSSTICKPACSQGQSCVNGKCVSTCNPPCSQGETCINGTCVSPPCNPPCNANEHCVSGVCITPPCPAGTCGGSQNCPCPQGQICNPNTNECCEPSCPVNSCGSDGCGGTCKCPPGLTCDQSTGKCIVQCVPIPCPAGSCGYDNCGNPCPPCPTGENCNPNTNQCQANCPGPQTCPVGWCGQTDCLNCPCPGGQTCNPQTNTCIQPCNPGCPVGQTCFKNQCLPDFFNMYPDPEKNKTIKSWSQGIYPNCQSCTISGQTFVQNSVIPVAGNLECICQGNDTSISITQAMTALDLDKNNNIISYNSTNTPFRYGGAICDLDGDCTRMAVPPSVNKNGKCNTCPNIKSQVCQDC